MRFVGKKQEVRYNFEFSTNRDSEKGLPSSEPALYFDTYGFATSNVKYLTNLFGSKINGDRFSTISSDPTLSITGKENVISAIEIMSYSRKWCMEK
jgi:hypothetical protein